MTARWVTIIDVWVKVSCQECIWVRFNIKMIYFQYWKYIMSSNVFDSLRSCCVNTNPLNPSDHRDISVQINTTVISRNTAEYQGSLKNKVAWHKVTEDDINEYKKYMDDLIDNIHIEQNFSVCNDPLCDDSNHHICIEHLCEQLIDTCLEASAQALPKCAPPRGCVPMWNEHIRPLRDDSLFWQRVWKDAGSPPVGALATIMRNTRARYHRAVKLHKRDSDKFRGSLIATSIADGNNRDLWKELKKLDTSTKIVPCSVNGFTESWDIANTFADKYRNLYTSVPTVPYEIQALKSNILEDISSCNEHGVEGISVADICNAITELKHQKSDGLRGTSSDHFIYCSHKFKVLLALMVNSMFVHGYTPNDLLESVLTSIPTDSRGNLCTDENYSGIALCSAICKIIDIVIINKYKDKLVTSELQFAYKSEMSSIMCTTILKEVCSYYQYRNTDVFVCMVDASKAFDRVYYGKLFDLLRKRKLPATVIRLLLHMFTRQRMRAVWNGSASVSFSIENGVKQGGILSPILFCVYIDVLLNCLIESKLGCHIGCVSYSAVGYADDVGLLTPSVQALQDILHICETFSEEFRVVFNSKMTTCMRIGSNGDPPARAVSLNGSPLTWTRRIKHLGNIITCDSEDITFKIGAFISQVNSLNCKMSEVSGNVKGQLLQTYCCSWYGCQTWDLASKSACQMNTEWNKAVRRTLRVPYTTHTNLLPLLVKGKPFMTQHFSRVSKFVQSFVRSNNTSVVFYRSTGALQFLWCSW